MSRRMIAICLSVLAVAIPASPNARTLPLEQYVFSQRWVISGVTRGAVK